jgi:DNA polymerase (family X)
MDRFTIALVLEEIAVLLELHGADRFRARAFRNAARAVERLDADPGALHRAGTLSAVRGIGPATGRVIAELVTTGASTMHADLRARTPVGMVRLLEVPGLGAARIAVLREHLGIESVEDLERALLAGDVAAVPGFGERTQQRLRAALDFVRGGTGCRRRPQALEAAARVGAVLRALAAVERVEAAGELRRGCEVVTRLPFVVAAEPARHADVIAAFTALPAAAAGEAGEAARQHGVDSSGDAAAGAAAARLRFADGFEVVLHVVQPAAFAPALVVATGSAAHVAALRSRAAGRGVAWHALGRDERSLYEALALAWVPPELRESGGREIEAAAAHSLPRLVEAGDVRGCLHCHTTYSDGAATLEEIARGGLERGWRYTGIADHSEAAGYAGGLDPDAVRRQHAEIDAWNERHGDRLWLFKGIEVDILADGDLDYARRAGLLESFDFVIGSVHSGFRSGRDEMTRRVLRALDDPRLTVLGHPTGRLLLSRAGYEIDLDAVIARAGERGVAIEINADPHRLELDWRHWPAARAHGVRTAINPDAHSVAGLDNVAHGIAIARKGWLRAEDVLTTWPFEALRDHFAVRRGGVRA